MNILFQNRDGQTPLAPEMLLDLKIRHVQDMTELYELESENIALGIAWAQSTNENHLDYLTWLKLHKQMLGEVWRFAGTVRKVELANPDFHLPYHVLPSLRELEQDLKTWIEFKTHDSQTMKAIFHEKLLTIHPFKDGNGRWSRVLTEFVCRKENFKIPDWGKIIKNDVERRDLYIKAIKKARHQSEYDELIKIMWWSN